MAYLERDRAKIYFEDNGTAGDGRPAILLSHGFGASSGMWQGQVDAFGDRFRMIRWDIRGHGHSEVGDDPALYSQDLSVADMAALLDHLGIEQAILAGHSLGGYLSLRFYAAHPERVIGLILQGTGPGFRNAEAREQWNEYARGRGAQLEAGGLSQLGGGTEVGASTQGSAKGLANAARGILTQADGRVMEILSDIAVPTVVIVGANDTNFLGGSAYMAKKIAGAGHVVIPDAGHGCNIDQPDLVNRALADYLSAF